MKMADFDMGSSLLLTTATMVNLIVKGLMKCFGMMIVLLVSYYGKENISEYELSFCPGIAYTMFSCASKWRVLKSGEINCYSLFL